MDHIASIRAALRASAPVLAIPVEGHAPVCVNAKLLKGALKGVEIDSVVVDHAYYRDNPHACVIVTGHAGHVRTSCKIRTIERHKALIAIREWSIREREKRVKVINQGVLSAQAQRELKKKQIEGEADKVLAQARKDEALILAAARSQINPVLEAVSAETRESVIESYAAFRAQLGTRKRGAVIRWKLAKLRKEKAEMVKNQGRRNKVMVLRRKKDAVRYAAVIYQIGELEKQYKELYPPVWIAREYWTDGGYWEDSFIAKRPKDQTVRGENHWRGEDHYNLKAEARRLKEARANIRALTPPADEETTQEQIAA